jgi:sulfite exporter TauE/SafE
MSTLLLTALGLGFLGSLHCVGMCGPIVLCLPQAGNSKLAFVMTRLAYNLGRIVTYAALGALCGMVGQLVSLAGFQKSLSIGAGMVIILTVLLPSKLMQKILPYNPAGVIVAKGRAWWAGLLSRRSVVSVFGIGVLNGFLPCGFLFLGLAAAATTGAAGSASVYMIMFGFGTVPALLITSVFAGFVGSGFRHRLLKLMPVAALAMGAILVLRGLSLGIPYLSPTLDPPISDGAHHSSSSCH